MDWLMEVYSLWEHGAHLHAGAATGTTVGADKWPGYHVAAHDRHQEPVYRVR